MILEERARWNCHPFFHTSSINVLTVSILLVLVCYGGADWIGSPASFPECRNAWLHSSAGLPVLYYLKTSTVVTHNLQLICNITSTVTFSNIIELVTHLNIVCIFSLLFEKVFIFKSIMWFTRSGIEIIILIMGVHVI